MPAYTPTTWLTDDIITAVKLNNMESGIDAANDAIDTLVLNDITNVSAAAPSDGDKLTYVSANARWEAVADAGGSFLPLSGGTLTGDLTIAAGAAIDFYTTGDQLRFVRDTSTRQAINFASGSDREAIKWSVNHTASEDLVFDALAFATAAKVYFDTQSGEGIVTRSATTATNVAGHLWPGTGGFVIDARLGDLSGGANLHLRTGGVDRILINHAGNIDVSKALDMNNNDIYGVDQLFHHGDTNTYIQFHTSDQFRVVTGGVERLEVNNSRTQIDNATVTGTLIIPVS